MKKILILLFTFLSLAGYSQTLEIYSNSGDEGFRLVENKTDTSFVQKLSYGSEYLKYVTPKTLGIYFTNYWGIRETGTYPVDSISVDGSTYSYFTDLQIKLDSIFTNFSGCGIGKGGIYNGDGTLKDSTTVDMDEYALNLIDGKVYIDSVLTLSDTVRIVDELPLIWFSETDASVDEKEWTLRSFNGDLSIAAWDDAKAIPTVPFSIDRTGTTIDNITLEGTQITASGELYNVGNIESTGDIIIGDTIKFDNALLTGTGTVTMSGNTLNFAGGDIGIGGVPAYDLDVTGSMRATQYVYANNSLITPIVLNAANADMKIYQQKAYPLVFYTNDVEVGRFSTAGNFGVGISPAYKLDVQGSGSSNMRISSTNSEVQTIIHRDENIGATSDLGFIEFGGDVSAVYRGYSRVRSKVGADNQQGQIYFQTLEDNVMTTQMTINEDGNVGIGIAAPSTTLHVDGITTIDSTLKLSGVGTLSDGIQFGDYDSGLFEYSDDELRFSINNVDWIRITGSRFGSRNSGEPVLQKVIASAIISNIHPNAADTNTGIGSAGLDSLSLIAGGAEGIRIAEESGGIIVNMNGAIIHKITTVNAATYDLAANDYILNVTYTTTGAVTSLTLPSARAVSGRTIIIKDAGGGATTYNITIDTEGAETIDGAATLVLNTNYESVTLYSDGSNWFII